MTTMTDTPAPQPGAAHAAARRQRDRRQREQAENLARAYRADGAARELNLPTPAWAARAIIAAEWAELVERERAAAKLRREIKLRILRANRVKGADGRGLPQRHPDRLSLDDIADLVGRDKMVVKRWTDRLAAADRSLIPAYDLDDQVPRPEERRG